MFLNIFLSIWLLATIAMLIFSIKENVYFPKTNKKEKVNFYEDDNIKLKIPSYSSNFKNLKGYVGGDVRIAKGMYYTQEEYEKFRNSVLEKELPLR